MSQEDLAEKLNVSRQAISRWENGSTKPDADNILQLSKLFAVTTDYLLNDEYESDNDLPKVKEVKEDQSGQILIYLAILMLMNLIVQFMCVFILKNLLFSLLSFIPFVSMILAYEYAYRKKPTERGKVFRKKFYKIAVWLGTYFPIRLLFLIVMSLYSRPYSTLALECVILAVYIGTALKIDLFIEESYLKNQN
ncbi:MAG: helix-turn-helix transcriptional regulator [Tissierellia bacterium]|nr:helix-turn-helix transcriptional regulator [Tissierellia bacterium]